MEIYRKHPKIPPKFKIPDFTISEDHFLNIYPHHEFIWTQEYQKNMA